MLIPVYRPRFIKEAELSKKRGNDMEKLKTVINLLLENKLLPAKYRNHKLKGNYIGLWECHVEPDVLLVYEKTDKEIIFTRLGTHSDLFKNS